MKKFTYSLLMLILVIPLTGCGIDLPIKTEQKTGPLVSEQITIPAPSSGSPLNMDLIFGAGKMIILPHPGDDLVSGTVAYNVADFKPDITITENRIQIKQGNLKLHAVPTVNEKIKNEWSLALSDHPLDLDIKAGAYSAELELGGLALTDLHLTDGASDVTVRFSAPNQAAMNAFRYETGASNITLQKLGNANFQTLIFQSGGGNYNLDFSGSLRRSANVFIETGLSRLVITVPENVPARAQFEGPLSKVNARGTWQESGQEYVQPGTGPELLFTIETKAGTVTLKNP